MPFMFDRPELGPIWNVFIVGAYGFCDLLMY